MLQCQNEEVVGKQVEVGLNFQMRMDFVRFSSELKDEDASKFVLKLGSKHERETEDFST